MGVPKFFRYISERYPCLSELVKEFQIPDFDNLYLDMNGIIHVCSHPNEFEPHFSITEEKIFASIFHYIETFENNEMENIVKCVQRTSCEVHICTSGFAPQEDVKNLWNKREDIRAGESTDSY